MIEQLNTYPIGCSMRLADAHKVEEMIAHTYAFSSIGITINRDRETYSPVQVEHIPVGEVLVVFDIPETGINMVNFFTEFSNVLNDGLTHGRKESEAIE